LTVDSILIYDTYHSSPLCIASGLHYAGLTDCSWSSDGHHLVVSSTDGYISMISFADGELGEVYHDDRTAALASQSSAPHPETTMKNLKSSISAEIKSAQKGMPSPPVKIDLPPCEPGQSAMIMAPPTKKARTASTTSSTVNTLGVRKKKKITPAQTAVQSGIKGEDINVMSDPMDVTGRQCTVEKEVVGGVTKLSLTSSTQ
jgi:chromatin assembly factor 1 subunit B